MKKRIHSLKDPRLRKIRCNFRSLLCLWYREIKENYRVQSFELRNDKSLSYEQRWDKLRRLREAREEIESKSSSAPISCEWCNSNMRDLVFEPSRRMWFCVTCYEEAHRLYPDKYP